MLKLRFNWKKFLLGLVITMALLLAVLPVVISPLAKYIIEKYDMKILGRHIRVGFVFISPFTGYVHISNLRVFDQSGDSIFFKAEGVSARFALLKMLKKTYQIDYITLNSPEGHIIQNRQALNFDDIIQHFTPKDTVKKAPKGEPVHFNILDIKLTNGKFYYTEQSIPVNYFIKEVNIESPGKKWDSDSMVFNIALKSGPSTGALDAKFGINFSSLEYKVEANIKKFDLRILNQYLKALSNFGTMRAVLDAGLKGGGNFGSKLQMKMAGNVSVTDFHFGKNDTVDYASFKELAVGMRELNPREMQYYFDTIKLVQPFFKYERYDHLDNIQRIFGVNGSKVTQANADSTKFNLLIELAKFVNDLAKNMVESYYQAKRLEIDSADIAFNDFSLREKFGIAANPLNISADSIDRNKQRINVYLNTGIDPYGKIRVSLSFDPNDYGYFDIDYGLKKVPITIFNPYVISYTSFPLDRGTLEFEGKMDVNNSNLKSDNHVLILDPRVSKKIKKGGTHWLPLPLIMSIARSNSEVIDYDIPIRGDLKSPKFKLKDVILQVLTNIFVKPPTTPYLVHVKETEKSVEELLSVKWQTHSTRLLHPQDVFMEQIAGFLHKNGNVSISFTPVEYAEKEKEYIMLYEAKKRYYLHEHKLRETDYTADDSLMVERLSPKDSFFVLYLKSLTHDTMLFTVQEKCVHILGNKFIENKFSELQQQRNRVMMAYFVEAGVQDRVKINRPNYTVPFNGFSYYRINYKGDVPDKLKKDYYEMEKLNEDPPREKYEHERIKNGGILSATH